MAFTPVKNDMMGNIKVFLTTAAIDLSICVSSSNLKVQKVQNRQLEAPTDSMTLQSLVSNEIKAKKHTAAEGLVWLVRYIHLHFSFAPKVI